MKRYLGIEFGSTRIKAALIDASFAPVASGDFTWKSSRVDGVWTYDMADAWRGLKTALAALPDRAGIAAAGVSGMMHGYLAFDKDWNLLTPFRTWQNTMTGVAAEKLTALFGFQIPQRWSIAHLYQAMLNGEAHVEKIAHITTLAGYIHHALTGENVLGVGEASGMFPIDGLDYDKRMLAQFDELASGYPWKLRDILPRVLPAGVCAGHLTEAGAALLDGLLPVGLPFAPPEGDAGTGMTATNAVAPTTGNVSAGTSIFSMVVLERPLSTVHPELDLVTTPTGKPVAMVHCNNCTNDMNAWVSVLGEAAELLGGSRDEIYTKLYRKSLEGEADCGGMLVCNYLAGEPVTGFDAGRPLVLRTPESRFTLANFLRAQLYATMATLKIGMDILASEHVRITSLTGHGGLFKTPGVCQRYLAAACNAPVTCLETAGEGGPYGMALLAAYLDDNGKPLEEFLNTRVFAHATGTTVAPDGADRAGFDRWLAAYQDALHVERCATERA